MARFAQRFGERGRLARSFRRPAENIRAAWGRIGALGLSCARTSRRDADWSDRDGRAPREFGARLWEPQRVHRCLFERHSE